MIDSDYNVAHEAQLKLRLHRKRDKVIESLVLDGVAEVHARELVDALIEAKNRRARMRGIASLALGCLLSLYPIATAFWYFNAAPGDVIRFNYFGMAFGPALVLVGICQLIFGMSEE
jgi:hypothetical protein